MMAVGVMAYKAQSRLSDPATATPPPASPGNQGNGEAIKPFFFCFLMAQKVYMAQVKISTARAWYCSRRGISDHIKRESNGCNGFDGFTPSNKMELLLARPKKVPFRWLHFMEQVGFQEVIWRRKWRALTHINQTAAWKGAPRQEWGKQTKGAVTADHQGQEGTEQK